MIALRPMLLAGAGLLLAACSAEAQTPTAEVTASVMPMVTPVPVLLPRAAFAAPVPAQTQAPQRPRPRRAAQPAPPEPPPGLARGEPAPVPNNDMEAPRRAAAQRTTPQLNPALIDPDLPQTGTVRDGASLQSREDRLLRQPAAGARLRLPFGY